MNYKKACDILELDPYEKHTKNKNTHSQLSTFVHVRVRSGNVHVCISNTISKYSYNEYSS